jgi:phosphatidylglycerol:prolipoprotein diacylglycerol transferase
MLNALAALTIEIDINPEIRQFGGLLLTWHGIFTAVGIAAGVFLAVLVGRRLGFIDDDVYSAALVAIPCGIIGARALYVVERWGDPGLKNAMDAVRLNEGGISIYGAVLGGIAGGLVYVWFRKLPMRRALDVSAFGALLGMAVGRIGDIINGEHFAKASSLPWAVRYTNLHSPSVVNHPQCALDPLTLQVPCAQHPAVAYEMIGDLLILGLLFLILRFARKDGVVFFSFLLLYSLMRFGVSELRLDSRVIIAGLTTPQVTALFVIAISLVGFLYVWRQPAAEAPPAAGAAALATGPPRG